MRRPARPSRSLGRAAARARRGAGYVAGQRAAQHVTHVGRRLPRAARRRRRRRAAFAVAVVASTGMPVGQRGEQVADAPVVGPEVVAPVADAVRLVDDEQPAACGERGSCSSRKRGLLSRSGVTSSTSTSSAASACAHVVPLVGVGGVDGHGADAGALGGGDLVAHEREQRRDDQGRPGARAPAAARWRRSRRPTCPSRCAARRAPAGARRRAPATASNWPSRKSARRPDERAAAPPRPSSSSPVSLVDVMRVMPPPR